MRKREVRLAELEERVKEHEELAKLAQGDKQMSLALLGVTGSTKSPQERAAEMVQDRAGQERVALELARRELEQAKSEKQRLSGAGPSIGDPLLLR